MNMLSVAETAALKECSRQNIIKLCKKGSIQNTVELDERNVLCYRIPLAALDAQLQSKYYKQHGATLTVVPTRKTAAPVQPALLDSFGADERREIDFWVDVLARWQSFRNNPQAESKAKIDSQFVLLLSLEHPEINVSIDILYRKQAALCANDYAGLVDKRGKWRKGKTDVPAQVQLIFNSFYLDEAQHPITKCLEYTEIWAQECAPQLLPIASLSTFRRRVLEIPYPVRILMREGEKAYYDKCSLYVRRDYESIAPNDFWVGDTHTYDVMTLGPNGKPHRLYLSAWLDARSGVFVGWCITDSASSQATLNALRKAILAYGIPKNVYVDNGREFLTFDIGGRGHRAKKKIANGAAPFEPPGVFKRLGIKMTNAIVRNARAKLVERYFLEVKNSLSRLFPTYTGGSVAEKPDRLKKVLKTDNIPTDEEFISTVNSLLGGYLNYQPYGGSVASDNGLPRIEVYKKHCKKQLMASEDDLRLMFMRTSKPVTVGRRGVAIKINGLDVEFYNKDFVTHWMNKKVYARYDPEDLSTCRIYDLADVFIGEILQDNTMNMSYFATKDEIAASQRQYRKAQKAVREAAAARMLPIADRPSALELMKIIAQRNLEGESEFKAKSIEITRASEKPLLEAVGANINMSRMAENAEMRIKKQKE